MMRLSHLIQDLQSLLRKHGDLYVGNDEGEELTGAEHLEAISSDDAPEIIGLCFGIQMTMASTGQAAPDDSDEDEEEDDDDQPLSLE